MHSALKHEPLGLIDRESSPEAGEKSGEYEIVLGRRQIASLLFIAIVLAVVFSAVSYLAGRTAGAKPLKLAAAPSPAATSTPPAPAATPGPGATPAPGATPVIEATTSVLPAEPALPILKRDNKPEPPMFAEPLPGAVYLQMGAVDKGMAMVFAAGLRKYGFDSFVAPGPSEKIFRVLIGPLPDPDSFRRAKAAVDAIDLGTFARRYQK
jgi:cell division septation protein DedD